MTSYMLATFYLAPWLMPFQPSLMYMERASVCTYLVMSRMRREFWCPLYRVFGGLPAARSFGTLFWRADPSETVHNVQRTCCSCKRSSSDVASIFFPLLSLLTEGGSFKSKQVKVLMLISLSQKKKGCNSDVSLLHRALKKRERRKEKKEKRKKEKQNCFLTSEEKTKWCLCCSLLEWLPLSRGFLRLRKKKKLLLTSVSRIWCLCLQDQRKKFSSKKCAFLSLSKTEKEIFPDFSLRRKKKKKMSVLFSLSWNTSETEEEHLLLTADQKIKIRMMIRSWPYCSSTWKDNQLEGGWTWGGGEKKKITSDFRGRKENLYKISWDRVNFFFLSCEQKKACVQPESLENKKKHWLFSKHAWPFWEGKTNRIWLLGGENTTSTLGKDRHIVQ